MKPPAEWQGRPLLDPADAKDLDLDAATREFSGKKDRASAEEGAHDDYRRKHHAEAASHHLRGMKAAQASGDQEAGKKHGAMYSLHMKALGHDPYGEPPPEITAHTKAEGKHDLYRFRAHRGDLFLLTGKQQPTQKSLKENDMADLKKNQDETLTAVLKAAKLAIAVLKKNEEEVEKGEELNALPPPNAPKITSRARAVGGNPAVSPKKPSPMEAKKAEMDAAKKICKSCGKKGELCKCSYAKSEPTSRAGHLAKSQAEARIKAREFFDNTYVPSAGFSYEK